MPIRSLVRTLVEHGYIVLPDPGAEREIAVQGSMVRLKWPPSDIRAAREKARELTGMAQK